MTQAKESRIWLSSPHMAGTEKKYVQEAFDSNWIAPLGPNVEGFERDIQEYTGAKHAAALNSGTGALHLALVLAGVGPGDYVICQSLTFSASANPITYLGATPVFVDSESQTWNMSPHLLELAIEDSIAGKLVSPSTQTRLPARKPKAIIPVHLYGMPAHMTPILEIASRYDIPVVEDAAESLGSTYQGRAMGTFGKMGILSFNGNKIVTTSGGGALISDDEDLVKRCRFLATQARDDFDHYEHSQIGYNYRLSNVLAGVGRGQMEVIDDRVKSRRRINQWYRDFLEHAAGIEFQSEPNEDYYSNYWLTSILINKEKTGFSCNELRKALEKREIEARPLWKPMHVQPVFHNAPFIGDGTAEEIFAQGVCLPSGSNLTGDELERIKSTILGLISAK